MDNIKRILQGLIIILILASWAPVARAAAPPPTTGQQEEDNFVYTVQPGDTLGAIARRYDLTPDDIIQANNLADPNVLFPGQRLVLPGVTLSSLTGDDSSLTRTAQTHVVQPGETLFTVANLYDLPLDALILANSLPNPDMIEIGQILTIPGSAPATAAPVEWPAPFGRVELSEPAIIQGRTLVIEVTLMQQTATLTGTFDGRPLFFTEQTELETGRKQFWSMAAVHALAEAGSYPITLTATVAGEEPVTTTLDMTVVDGPYRQEDIQLSNERGELLDPELRRLEMEKLMNLWSQVSPRPLWAGPFRYPIQSDTWRITSTYGTRRSYNGSDSPIGFHEGVDFGGSAGAPIYAPAAGKVVLAEALVVRGNAVVIDHGLGLFSGYWHQSQLVVQAGQEVQAGDLIGYVGDTGLATGPHLHWEMRLNGIAVEPLQWIQQVIP
jgi:murein DD-endopeptidase MepM/ murein hydrolase activator NlpD